MDWTIVAGRPVYLQLIEQLELAIITGEYPPGEKIPGARPRRSGAGQSRIPCSARWPRLEARGLLDTQRTARAHRHLRHRPDWRRHGRRSPPTLAQDFLCVRRRRSALPASRTASRCFNRRRGNHGGYLHRTTILNKKYGGRAALRDVSFSIEPGKSGRSARPERRGQIHADQMFDGAAHADFRRNRHRRRETRPGEPKSITSYLPDRMALSSGLRVRDAVAMYADFFTDFDRTKARDMLLDLKLDDGQRIGAMSKGMREKMQLCLVMARAARLYLLDEPLGGVDPAARDYILNTILRNYSENAVRRALHPSDRGYRARAGRGADAQR